MKKKEKMKKNEKNEKMKEKKKNEKMEKKKGASLLSAIAGVTVEN